MKKKPITTPYRHSIRTNLPEFWEDLNNAMDISDHDSGIYTNYVSTNGKSKQVGTLELEFNNKFVFAFAFRAQYTGESKIQKEIRFFYKEKKNSHWIMSFSAPIRNEFIQSAIIPSFRDPSRELRINSWSWYGKLLKTYTEEDNQQLLDAFQQVKQASNEVFKDLRTEINNSNVKVAFPDTTVSFQFNPEAKFDFYKNALIYVNDGHDSPLHDKGAGIQSAVIIGLFNYYTKVVTQSNCSLLAIEEPELYLHPQARRVMANRLDDFVDNNKHQVIITTHSTEFITSAHENINIILAKKDISKATTAKNAKFDTSKERQILLKVQNAEMFFADTVILVEGGEKYVVEAAAKHYGLNVKPYIGENWLNERNYSVISVGGKSEFHKYYKKLKELGIPVYVMADFDFFVRLLSEFLTEVGAKKEKKDYLNGLKGKINSKTPEIAKDILQRMAEFKEFLNQKGFTLNEKEIKSKIRESLRIKNIMNIPEEIRDEVSRYIDTLKDEQVFILKGELEDYYKEKCLKLLSGINGKEEKPIYICSNLLNHNEITELMEIDEYKCLFDLITTNFVEPVEEVTKPVDIVELLSVDDCEDSSEENVAMQ